MRDPTSCEEHRAGAVATILQPAARRPGPPPQVKRKVVLGALLWALLITLLHVQLNVGWARLGRQILGRKELVVGFLPVT